MAKQATVGAFILNKLSNMAKWVDLEVGTEACQKLVKGRTEMEATYMAEMLLSHSDEVGHRNWDDLVALTDLPAEVLAIAEAVRAREDMHDKFWRYLELFVQTVREDD